MTFSISITKPAEIAKVDKFRMTLTKKHTRMDESDKLATNEKISYFGFGNLANYVIAIIPIHACHLA